MLPFFWEFPAFPKIDYTFFWWIYYIWLFFFAYEGLYTKRFSFWDEVKMLWKVSFFSTLGIFTVLYLGKIGEQVSRTVIVLMGVMSLPLLPFIRINAKRMLYNIGILKRKALILGAGKTGTMIYNALKKDRNFGLNVVGFLDDDPSKKGTTIQDIKIHIHIYIKCLWNYWITKDYFRFYYISNNINYSFSIAWHEIRYKN